MTMRCRVRKFSVRTPITKIRVIAGEPEPSAPGQLPEPAREAMVYASINGAYIAADCRPITLSANKQAKATGTREQADTSIANLEHRKLIRREPGRASTVPLFSAAAF
jgi:hypothetical protein